MMSNKKPATDIGAPDDHIRPDLDKLVAEWQKILREQDTDFSIRYARHYEMENQGAVGECAPMPKLNRAAINILEPHDQSPKMHKHTRDVTMTTVHEMLHVPFERGKPADTDVKMTASEFWDMTEPWRESMIDRLSVILVNLHRAAKP